MSQQYYELDKEEQELLDSVEGGEWTSVPNQRKQSKEMQQAARMQNNKTRNINVRISERDLRKLKVKAQAEGMPYQTLVASILHKSV